MVMRKDDDDEVAFLPIENADVGATPLGVLMRELALEIGLQPGRFRFRVKQYGILKISLEIHRARDEA